MSKAINASLGFVLIFSLVISDQAEARRSRSRSKRRPSAVQNEKKPTSGPSLQWTKRMKGAISNLALSRSGKQILVATFADSDIPGSAKHALLSLWSTQGKLLWEQKANAPIKDIAISPDGQLIVLSTYLDELIGIDARGRRIWNTTGLCKPYVLQEPKRVICYHDDDAGPDVAFDVLDWDGKKVGGFPIQKDIVAFKFSDDQKSLAIALNSGEVVLFDSELKPVWRRKLDGEIVDLAVAGSEQSNLIPPASSSPTPSPSSISRFRVAALVRTDRKTQQVEFLDDQGQTLGHVTPSFPVEQLESSPDGQIALYYGNSATGQWIAGASFSSLKEVWKQGEPSSSRYSGSINLSPGLIWAGVEHRSEKPIQRESRVFIFDLNGNKVHDLDLPKDDTAYLFSHRIAMVPNWFVVGTDDAKLSVYQF